MAAPANLLVDVGNSRFKWLWQGEPPRRGGAWLHELDLDAQWGQVGPPSKVVVSSVAGPEIQNTITSWCARNWSLEAAFIESRAQELGVINGYRDPSQLGPDRWAALLGARALSRSAAAVVDCGTAVTVDALSADGRFIGGVIMPGSELMWASLSGGTRRITGARASQPGPFGRSTAECVQAGITRAVSGGVERVLGELREALGEEMCVLATGGGAPALIEQLPVPVQHQPDLVLDGLARIAEQR